MEGSASGCPSHHHHRAALSFTVAPLSPSVLLCFLMGTVLILVGMMFFTTGAETAMTPMGERIGTAMTKAKKLGVVITLSFLLGFIITVSEPDLQVLASQVPSVPNLILILSVACGVGMFLVVSLLRMLFSIALPPHSPIWTKTRSSNCKGGRLWATIYTG